MSMMDAIRRWLGPREERTMSLSELDALMDRAVLSSTESSAGIWVDQSTAMTSAVVYACVNVLSQAIASLPLIVYRKLPNGGKERAPEHRLYPILHDLPNPEMTSYELRAALVGHLLLWGNAYCEIELSDAGVNALWPLRPDRMTPGRDEGNRLVYDYRLPDGTTKRFQFRQIMHWRGLSSNGIVGYSPIQQAAESVGIDLATRQYGASFFGNGSQPGGILVHPGRLSEEAGKRLKSSWEEAHRGLSTAQRVAVLEEGMTWTSVGVPPEQAQFLETRKYGRSEIAALYRVPLHMINDLERATFSNIEHQSLEFVKYTLMPWLVCIEQSLMRDLFAVSEGKRSHFAEHLVDGMLRGDIQSRYAAYNIAHNGGWMSADEIREYENMNPIPAGQGSYYWMPANMMTVERALEPPVEAAPVAPAAPAVDDVDGVDEEGEEDEERSARREVRAGKPGAGRYRLAVSYTPTLQGAAQRLVDQETEDLRRGALKLKTSRKAFETWLAQYLEAHPELVRRFIETPTATYGALVAAEVERELGREFDRTGYERFVGGYTNSRSNVWTGDLRRAIEKALAAAVDGVDAADALDGVIEERQGTEAGRWASDQGNRAMNAFAKTAMAIAGVTTLTWVNYGSDVCPFCEEMNGRSVSIAGAFLGAGERIEASGESPFVSGDDVGHPPLHDGCQCVVVAG